MRFTLRIENDLREALTAVARQNARSMNSELKYRLRQTLDQNQDAPTA